MSTNNKTNSHDSSENNAQRELSKAAKRLTRKRRETVQVRIGKTWHQRLQSDSKKWGLTLSGLMDIVAGFYLKNSTHNEQTSNDV